MNTAHLSALNCTQMATVSKWPYFDTSVVIEYYIIDKICHQNALFDKYKVCLFRIKLLYLSEKDFMT